MCSILICDKNKERLGKLSDGLRKLDLRTYMPDDPEIIEGSSCEELMLKMAKNDIEPAAAFIYAGPDDRHGVETAGILTRNHPGVKIVFVCDSDQYIKSLYEIDFTYRLQLPASEEDLASVMERVSKTGRWKSNEYLTVKMRSTIYKIPFRSIFYFEKSYRKINIVSEEGVYTFYGKMEMLTGMLPDNFIRCHNSYIVNFDKIIMMENNYLNFSRRSLCDDMKEKIPVSRTYYADVRNKFD